MNDSKTSRTPGVGQEKFLQRRVDVVNPFYGGYARETRGLKFATHKIVTQNAEKGYSTMYEGL